MIDTYTFYKRLFYVVTYNRNIDPEHFEDLKVLIRRVFYVPTSVSATSLIILFSYHSKGYFQFPGPTDAIKSIKSTYFIMALSLLIGFFPSAYYCFKVSNKLSEILEISKEKNYFSPRELRLIHDEEYFNQVVIEPNSS